MLLAIDSTAILLAIIGLAGTALTLIFQLMMSRAQSRHEIELAKLSRKTDVYHKEVNGRMGELLEAKKQEGKQEEKDEQAGREKQKP